MRVKGRYIRMVWPGVLRRVFHKAVCEGCESVVHFLY